MERDDLIGDEDQIELALHLSRNGKELALPVIPRFVFSMQSITDVWRLNEVSVTVRVPLSDPNFLKTLEDDQRTRNEGRAMWSVQQVNTAETGFFKSQGHFACSLALLGKQIGEGESAVTYLDNPQLAKGSVSGYIFAITGCDATHYKIAGEPAVANTGLRAFCSGESGEIRAAANGKATTCLSSGEVAQQAPAEQATGVAVVAPAPSQATGTAAEPGNAGAATGAKAQNGAPTVPAQRQAQAVHMTPATADERPGTTGAPQRIRVSAGVMQGLLISEVQPVYPTMERINVEGPVVLAVVIGKNGAVQSAKITSSPSPLLNSAALDAVRQWKFRPYLLNGKPLEVDTTITVTFTLPKK